MKYQLLRFSMLSAFLMLMAVPLAQAQSVLVVEPGPPGTLNDVIEGDVDRPDDRVYVLKRGVYYGLTRPLENADYVLRLKAEDPEDADPALSHMLPVIIPAADQAGSTPGNGYIRFTGDSYVDGIYFLAVTANGGAGQGIPYRLNGEGMVFEARNSVFEGGRSRFFEINADNTKIYIYDSHFRNTPRTDMTSSNGRPFDYRTVEADTLVIENTTFANIGGYIVRYDGPRMNHFRFNHNTIHTLLQFPFNGPVSTQSKEYIVTNNLFVNPHLRGLGNPSDDEPLDGIIRVDSMDASIEVDFSESDRTIVVENNGLMYTADILDLYARLTALEDTVHAAVLIDQPTAGEYGEANAHASFANNEDVNVTFTLPPDLSEFIQTYEQFREGDPNITDWFFGDKENGLWPANQPLPEVYSYNTDAEAYRMADRGYPLGDLNWFPELKERWLTGEDAEDDNGGVSNEPAFGKHGFALRGSYPNPAADRATIEIAIGTPAQVSVAVYDVLGREVMALPEQSLPASERHALSIDTSTLANGTYLYRVRADVGGAHEVKAGAFVIVR